MRLRTDSLLKQYLIPIQGDYGIATQCDAVLNFVTPVTDLGTTTGNSDVVALWIFRVDLDSILRPTGENI